jgi:tryptophan halogenase
VRWDDEEVSSAKLDSNGRIAALTCRSGREVHGDFFIDCTGFRRKLMSLAFGDSADAPQWRSFADYLHCDSAVYFTLPPDSPNVRPSTLGTALSSGWVWDIPLRDQISLGYVYSSKFQDAESAEREFREFVGRGHDRPVGTLRWTPGMLDRAWVRNCLAIGVSNSFMEPIESLTSATLTVELRHLLVNFPNRNFNDAGIERYNSAITKQCVDNRDFISLHYVTGGRDDTPFWRAIQRDTARSDRVQALLRDYRRQAPHTLEGIYDVKAIFGMFTARGILPGDDFPLLEFVDHEGAEDRFRAIQQEHSQLRDRYMDHSQFLKAIASATLAA